MRAEHYDSKYAASIVPLSPRAHQCVLPLDAQSRRARERERENRRSCGVVPLLHIQTLCIDVCACLCVPVSGRLSVCVPFCRTGCIAVQLFTGFHPLSYSRQFVLRATVNNQTNITPYTGNRDGGGCAVEIDIVVSK